MALPFHDYGTRRGEGPASRPGRSLLPGKTRYPLYRRLGGPEGRSVGNLAPHRDSIPGRLSPQPVAIPTMLLGPQPTSGGKVILQETNIRSVEEKIRHLLRNPEVRYVAHRNQLLASILRHVDSFHILTNYSSGYLKILGYSQV